MPFKRLMKNTAGAKIDLSPAIKNHQFLEVVSGFLFCFVLFSEEIDFIMIKI